MVTLLGIHVMAAAVLIMWRVVRVFGLGALLMELTLSHQTRDAAHAHTSMVVMFARMRAP